MHNSERDIELTRRALELAEAGVGLVSPNPLVGCVVTDADGEIAGEGTYLYAQLTHAEVLALEQAGDRARGGTAYVSLEPHSHHGKTPPCTEALLDAGIKRVVCPIEDPNPLVSGKGFERLREAGVEVVTGILELEASRQNEKFICWHLKGRPFVHLKLAMSLDGRISIGRGLTSMLSGSEARKRVHEIRHEHDAILIGGNTASVDDPVLTDRSGLPRRRPLVRVVLDNSLRLLAGSKLASTAADVPTILFTNSTDSVALEGLKDAGVEIVRSDAGARDLSSVLAELRTREVQSILVEGGTQVAGAFIESGFVDKVTFIYAPLVIGGESAPVAVGGGGPLSLEHALRLRNVTSSQLGADIEVTGYTE